MPAKKYQLYSIHMDSSTTDDRPIAIVYITEPWLVATPNLDESSLSVTSLGDKDQLGLLYRLH